MNPHAYGGRGGARNTKPARQGGGGSSNPPRGCRKKFTEAMIVAFIVFAGLTALVLDSIYRL